MHALQNVHTAFHGDRETRKVMCTCPPLCLIDLPGALLTYPRQCFGLLNCGKRAGEARATEATACILFTGFVYGACAETVHGHGQPLL